jgi:hypothetical protein
MVSTVSLSVSFSMTHELVPLRQEPHLASVGGVFAGGARLGLTSAARRGVGMATGSRASSSTGSHGTSGQASTGGQPLCPFCRTPTAVERTSRTLKNPDKQFYTCTKRGLVSSCCLSSFISESRSRVLLFYLGFQFHEQGNSNCDFFMWKPISDGDGVDAETLMAGLQALHNSV